MYEIDPTRTDLVAEFMSNPGGPHSEELRLVVNRLHMMPLEDRHILICTRRGREWVLAKMPKRRGDRVELIEGQVFSDYDDGVREVFRRRWATVTGTEIAS